MKNVFSFLTLVVLIQLSLSAQNTLKLELNHLFKGEPFMLNQNFTDNQDRAVRVERARYYLSSLKVTHDGGQQTPLNGIYILGEGNVTNYSIDSTYAISSIEKIEFDLGVDYVANHGNTSNYPPSHPLGPKVPPMDWGWPSGYFFLTLHGKVDNNDDGNPNKPFQVECFGDVLLRSIDPLEFSSPLEVENGQITIPLYVNVDRWFNNMDLASVGFQHGAYTSNVKAVDNTNEEQVFTTNVADTTSSISTSRLVTNIYTDYTLPYAPVLFYNLPKDDYALSIYDIQGKPVVNEKNIGFEGNYFVKSELPSGVYIAIFNSGNIQQRHQFTVTR